MVDINTSLQEVNSEYTAIEKNLNVRYTMQLRKGYNYTGDVLTSKSTTVTFNMLADTPNVDDITLPWGLTNIPWLASNNFQFQSYSLNPNYNNNLASYTAWTETYIMYSNTSEDEDFYEVTEEVTMPTWNLKFFYMNNPNIGTNFEQLPKSERIRQVFGLKPISGRITAKSLKEISHDPYQIINKSFDGFNGVITDASLQEGKEENISVWQLNVSWISGDISGTQVPTYNLQDGLV